MKFKHFLICFMILVAAVSCKKEEFVSVEVLKNRALGGDMEAITRLIDLFEAGDIKTKSEAYTAVIEIDEGAVDTLLSELDGSTGDRWEYIIAALGMIKDKRAVDKIIKILKGNGKRRYVAAFALGQINDNKGTLALIDALDDTDPEVKRYSAIAIIKNPKGDTKAKTPLDVTAELIKYLGKPGVNDKDFALSAIGELKDVRAVDAVIKELNGNSRTQAIWALGKLKDTRAVEPLIKELKNTDWRIRVAAERSLGGIHSEKAVSALEKNLEDENVFVREWAARALEDITGTDYKYEKENGEYEIPTSLYR